MSHHHDQQLSRQAHQRAPATCDMQVQLQQLQHCTGTAPAAAALLQEINNNLSNDDNK